jgi:hypothetical protein
MSKRKATAAPDDEPTAKRIELLDTLDDNDVRVSTFVTKELLEEFVKLAHPHLLYFREPNTYPGHAIPMSLKFTTHMADKIQTVLGWFRITSCVQFTRVNLYTTKSCAIAFFMPYSSYPSAQLASLDRRAVVRFAHDHGVLFWREGQLPMPDFYLRNYPWWRHWVLKGLQKKTCTDVVNKVFEFIGLPLHSL